MQAEEDDNPLFSSTLKDSSSSANKNKDSLFADTVQAQYQHDSFTEKLLDRSHNFSTQDDAFDLFDLAASKATTTDDSDDEEEKAKLAEEQRKAAEQQGGVQTHRKLCLHRLNSGRESSGNGAKRGRRKSGT